MTKRIILIAVSILSFSSSITLFVLGKNGFPVIFIGAWAIFILYGVWNAPGKHKSFGYLDQQRAMRAFDRTDLLNFEVGSSSKKKKNKKRTRT